MTWRQYHTSFLKVDSLVMKKAHLQVHNHRELEGLNRNRWNTVSDEIGDIPRTTNETVEGFVKPEFYRVGGQKPQSQMSE